MAYLVTNAIQDALSIIGRSAYYRTVLTGGSATTFIDTTLGDKYDDESLINATLIVVRDATGGGVAPEGEMVQIASYLQSSTTGTFKTVDHMSADGTFAASTGWTVGTGWAIGTNVATHTAGNTGTLAGTTFAKDLHTTYMVSFVVAATSVGDGFTVSLGGTTDATVFSTAGTKTIYIAPTDTTGTITFTPGAAGTFAGTVDTVVVYAVLSSPLASGDDVMIILPRFPLHDLRRQLNIALQALGDLELNYTGITTVAVDSEYNLPVAYKRERPIKILYQSKTTDADDNEWVELGNSQYSIHPAAPGTASRIIFHGSFPVGHTLKIIYSGAHPDVYHWNDPIAECIPPTLLAHELAYRLICFYGIKNSTRELANRIQKDLEGLRLTSPVQKPDKQPRGLTFEKSYTHADRCPDPFL